MGLKFFTAIGGMFAAASLGYGEEAATTEAKVVAPLQQILPNSYGSLQLRHRTMVHADGTDVQNIKPFLQVRPTIGSTFFDGKLDSYFTFIFTKNPGTTKVEDSRDFNWTELNLITGDYGHIKPFIYAELPHAGSGTDALVGLTNLAKTKELTTAIGAVQFKGYLDVYGSQTSRSKPVEGVENNTAQPGSDFSLVGDNSDTLPDQRHPSITAEPGIGISVKPNVLNGVKVGLNTFVTRVWDPTYRTAIDGGENVVQLDGYDVSDSNYSILSLSYAFENGLSVNNQARFYGDGIYEASKKAAAGPRFENRLMVTYSLF